MSHEQETFDPPDSLDGLGRIGLGVGVAGTAACVAGALLTPAQLYRSYLTGYLWFLGFVLGSLSLMMLHHVSRGAWGVMIRRIFEAVTRTFPFVVLAFLPIVAGMHGLYEWTHADVVAADRILRHKAPWLNTDAFLIRAAVYFTIWGGLSWILNALSRRQDATADRSLSKRMQNWSAAGLLLYALTMSLAAFDWAMSLTPHWTSTIYGLYMIIGQSVTAMAFACLMALVLGSGEKPAVPFQPRHIHDYGKLLFAFVCVWAYFGYSQFIIIWSGNLPEETSWFVPRMNGAWRATTVVLLALHYAVPFVLLLSKSRKRSARALAPVAGLLLAARWLDLHWMIAPTFSRGSFAIHWLDLAVPAALGGLGFWLFTVQLKKRPLVPIQEPFLKEALAHE